MFLPKINLTFNEKALVALSTIAIAGMYYELWLIHHMNNDLTEYGRQFDRLRDFQKKLAEHVDPDILDKLIFEHKFEDIVYHEEKK